jgi:hypothetical protein
MLASDTWILKGGVDPDFDAGQQPHQVGHAHRTLIDEARLIYLKVLAARTC